MLAVGLCTQLACIWEAAARKPGNVHRYCDFEDASFVDFLVSAAAIAPVLDTASKRRVGDTVLQAIQATRRVTATNTNLGIVLLLTPLATVAAGQTLQDRLGYILQDLDVDDSRKVYEAIRLAQPGGLGRARDQDVQEEPTIPLRQIMQLAADRDLIARQYANAFEDVFTTGVPALLEGLRRAASLEEAIILCHLRWMAAFPDSLIARKRGRTEAEEASRRAQRVLDAGWPRTPSGASEIAVLDNWLRSEGRARNPGTSADLVTASLFVALREGIIPVPRSFGPGAP
jgi:triphosphoribosyl-dephospho-CoA synthase